MNYDYKLWIINMLITVKAVKLFSSSRLKQLVLLSSSKAPRTPDLHM